MDENELPGQGAPDAPPETAQSGALSGDEATSSGTEGEVDVVKELQDRLSAQGRELQQTKLRAERAEGFVSQVATRLQETESRLESLGASLTARERREEEAYLASLPSDQQEPEKLRRRVARLEAALSAGQAGQPQTRTREQEEAETVRAASQMAAQACVDFGLEEGEAFGWNDPRLDLRSPEAYYASARRLARKISAGQESPTPPQTRQSIWGGESSSMPNNVHRGEPRRGAPDASQIDVQKLVRDTAKEVIRELQGQTGGASHTARAASPAPNPFADLVTDRKADPYQRALDGYKNTQGPRATRAKLRETLNAAEDAFGRAAR
jgi:hypothetical protein